MSNRLEDFKGKRLTKAREYRGLSLEELSELSGIPVKRIDAICLDMVMPGVEELFTFSRVLNFPAAYFLTEPKIKVEMCGGYFCKLH